MPSPRLPLHAAPARAAGALVLVALAGFAQQAPSEKELLRDLRKGLRAPAAYEREVAIATFSGATRELEDGGTSRAVARALAGALDDEAPSVRAAAVAALSWGRHVETTIDALEDVLEETIREVDARWTRPDDESKAWVRDGRRLVEDAARAAGRYADDAMVEALADRLAALRAGNQRGRSYADEAALVLSRALLAIGTREAVETVVARTRQYVGARRERAARRLHEALADFSAERGFGPPAFAHTTFDQDWHEWLDEHEDAFAESVELEQPPPEPPRRRGRRDEPRGRPRR